MKKIITLYFLFLCFPFLCFCQWNNHYYFNIMVNPPWTSSFQDAVFISSDTGYYCYTEYSPSSSTYDNAIIKKTTDDCITWNTDNLFSNTNVSSAAVKYFYPHIYFLFNNQGILNICRRKEGSNWQFMQSTPGFYLDFFANDSSNYKILYVDYSNRIILRYFENNIEVRKDTFLTYKPRKIYYPIDTVGILLSSSLSGTGYNTTIMRYANSSGYNLVYQNQNQKLSDLYFTSGRIGYISGDSGTVFRSNDLGISWNIFNTGFAKKLNSIYFVNDSTGYVVGDSGLIIKTLNYGLSWQQQTSPITTNLNKVFFVNDSVGFILSGQVLLKTINGGVAWINEISIAKNNNLIVSPNPTTNKCNVTVPDEFLHEKNLVLSIYDNTGKLIQQKTLQMNDGKIKLDLEAEAKGIYNVVLSSKKKSYSGKIVFE